MGSLNALIKSRLEEKQRAKDLEDFLGRRKRFIGRSVDWEEKCLDADLAALEREEKLNSLGETDE